MLNVGDKVYYLDYEDSHHSYTIVKAPELNSLGLLCYTIHSDQLSNLTGYYPLLVDVIDKPESRFFSSPEKAKQAYEIFKQKRRQYNGI